MAHFTLKSPAPSVGAFWPWAKLGVVVAAVKKKEDNKQRTAAKLARVKPHVVLLVSVSGLRFEIELSRNFLLPPKYGNQCTPIFPARNPVK
jgi:hypothetical protein